MSAYLKIIRRFFGWILFLIAAGLPVAPNAQDTEAPTFTSFSASKTGDISGGSIQISISAIIEDNTCLTFRGVSLSSAVKVNGVSYGLASVDDGGVAKNQVSAKKVGVSGNIIISGIPCCSAVAEITLTAHDCLPSPNTGSQTQIVNLTDATPPVVSSPPNAVLSCLADLPVLPTTPADFIAQGGSASDNCTPQTDLIITGSDSPLAGSACGGRIIRTFSIEDLCNNQVTVTQVFTIQDTAAPDAVAPPAQPCQSLAEIPPGASTYAEFIALGGTAQDDCTLPADLTISYSDSPPTGDTCLKFVTRTYTIRDACGNQNQVQHNISVQDTTKPVLTAPPGQAFQSMSEIPARPTNYAEFLAQGGQASDNVTPQTELFVTVSDSPLSGALCNATVTRTFTIQDACLNRESATQIFTVGDTIPPVATAPPDLRVASTSDIPARATDFATYRSQGGTASDNVTSPENLSISSVENILPAGALSGRIVRTYTIRDACNNQVQVTQTIILSPNIPWPMPGFDAQRTGRSPYSGIADSWLVMRTQRREEYDKPGLEGWLAAPSYLLIGPEGNAYFKTKKYRGGKLATEDVLAAFNPKTRQVLWTSPIAGGFAWTPAVDFQGTIFVYNPQGILSGLDPQTGSAVWSSLSSQTAPGRLMLTDILVSPAGNVFASCGPDIVAFGPPAGTTNPSRSLLWTFNRFGPAPKDWDFSYQSLRPALTPQGQLILVYRANPAAIPTPAYKLVAIGGNGSKSWELELGGVPDNYYPLLVNPDGTIYVILKGGCFRCPEMEHGAITAVASDGTIKWHRKLPDVGPDFQINQPVLGKDNKLYFLTRADLWGKGEIVLHALNTADGTDAWTAGLSGIIRASGVTDAESLLKSYGSLKGLPSLIDQQGTWYVFVSGHPELLLIDTAGRRLISRFDESGASHPENLAMDADGKLCFATSAWNYGTPGSCALPFGSPGIMVMVPYAPPVSSLRVLKETKRFFPYRKQLETTVEFECDIQDPRGETDVILSIDFGDGEKGCFDWIRTTPGQAGLYGTKITFSHTYRKEGDYQVVSSVVGWQMEPPNRRVLKPFSQSSLLVAAKDSKPPSLGSDIRCEVVEDPSKKTHTFTIPHPKVNLLHEAKATFTGTAVDDPDGCGLWKIQYRVGTGPWQDAQGRDSWNFSLPLTAQDMNVGAYDIHIRALDYVGNTSVEALQTIVCDRRRPYIVNYLVSGAPAGGGVAGVYRTSPPRAGDPYLSNWYYIFVQVKNPHPEWTFNVTFGLEEKRAEFKWSSPTEYWDSGLGQGALSSWGPATYSLKPNESIWVTTEWLHRWNWIPDKDYNDFLASVAEAGADVIFDVLEIPVIGTVLDILGIIEFLATQTNSITQVKWYSSPVQAISTPPDSIGSEPLPLDFWPPLSLSSGAYPFSATVKVSDAKINNFVGSFEANLTAGLATGMGVALAPVWPVGTIAAVALFAMEATLLVCSHLFYEAAHDPAPDYKVSVEIVPIKCAEFDRVEDEKEREAARAALNLAENATAYRKAFARYQGALEAKDGEWARRQADDAAKFARQAAGSCRAIHYFLSSHIDILTKMTAGEKKKFLASQDPNRLPSQEEQVLMTCFGYDLKSLQSLAKQYARLSATLVEKPHVGLKACQDLERNLLAVAEALSKKD